MGGNVSQERGWCVKKRNGELLLRLSYANREGAVKTIMEMLYGMPWQKIQELYEYTVVEVVVSEAE